jgi:hypothetical protein
VKSRSLKILVVCRAKLITGTFAWVSNAIPSSVT